MSHEPLSRDDAGIFKTARRFIRGLVKELKPIHDESHGVFCICENATDWVNAVLENSQPPDRGTRKCPLEFPTLADAKEHSEKHCILVWAKVADQSGVFQIYPGGRTIHHRFPPLEPVTPAGEKP